MGEGAGPEPARGWASDRGGGRGGLAALRIRPGLQGRGRAPRRQRDHGLGPASGDGHGHPAPRVALPPRP